MARGAIEALHEAGRAVPGDVLVGGFDDSAGAEDEAPPLTTIRQDFAALAEVAVSALVAEIESADGDADAGSHVVPTELIERSSTH